MPSLEEKWVKKWKEAKIFEADPDPKREKVFVTFPYMYCNSGMHLGHVFTASHVDVYARFKRMQGYNVLFPWAWHWTGTTIVGVAERLKRGDMNQYRIFKDMDEVPEDILSKFIDPHVIAEYFTNENRETVSLIGFSIDWRREFTTIDPYYKKFIEWQYLTLKRLGYVVKGTHPVVWCVNCSSPTGDHDRLVGEGVSPEEYYVVLFKCGEYYLAAATFRPETIFGATNVWVNPDIEYVIASYEDKKIIVSKEAIEKLSLQKRDIKIIDKISALELIGKKCTIPIVNNEIIILPANFVKADIGTGIVYSVPAHAPYDLAALKDLKNKANEISIKYKININEILSIEPISIISTPGFGDFPAEEINSKLGVKNQNDIEKLEEATKTIYMKEFYEGITKNNCGEFSNLSVKEAKEKIKDKLSKIGLGLCMYDLPEPVICRCGTKCVVKILEDQWFLNYSNEQWKNKVRDLLYNMKIYPEEARQWFLNVVDWLHDWPCARKSGLGTPLPWDKTWIVETLSDSTIYMAFYTIRKYLNEKGPIPIDKIDYKFFDYVFLGIGDVNQLAKEINVNPEIIKKIREEFLYWYPVDLRDSAKELLPNHLTFYLFHHVAIFPKELWPKTIVVNGMITLEGKKMSKSKGIFYLAKKAIENFGADATRCALLIAAEDMNDADWREKNAIDIKKTLDSFLELVKDFSNKEINEEIDEIDIWLLSRLQKKIKQITELLEKVKTKTALEIALYEMLNDWKWYIRKKKSKESSIYTKYSKEFIKTWIKLLAPYAPFTCEEAWSIIGEKGFVSLAEWPKVDEGKINEKIEFEEKYISIILEDVWNIKKVLKEAPEKIYFYCPSKWKKELAKFLIDYGLSKAIANSKNLIKETIKVFPERKNEIPKILKKLIDTLSSYNIEENIDLWKKIIDSEDEILKKNLKFLENELKCQVIMFSEEDKDIYDPTKKASTSLPLKPGIYFSFTK
jgi:leucyl-tRNA synthetase